jgi:hypothetical protein
MVSLQCDFNRHFRKGVWIEILPQGFAAFVRNLRFYCHEMEIDRGIFCRHEFALRHSCEDIDLKRERLKKIVPGLFDYFCGKRSERREDYCSEQSFT